MKSQIEKKAWHGVKKEFNAWKNEILRHGRLIIISLIFVAIAVVLDYLASSYAQRMGTVVAPDLILDHLHAIDLSFIFVYGFVIIMAVLLAYPLFFRISKLHVALGQYSLLVVVRSIFICFTHLKTPADAIPASFPGIFNVLRFNNDLFFSGHTAIPFLGFLVFYDNKFMRYFCLAASILMGATALLTHQHYSIDVFSAFFITYGTFKAGEWGFRKINHY